MKVTDLNRIIESALEIAPNEEYAEHTGWLQFIKDCRTFTFGLPRRSGKSTLALQYAYNKSALVVVPRKSFVPAYTGSKEIITLDEFCRLSERLRGVNRHGLRYQCFIFDEVQKMNSREESLFIETLLFLKQHNFLTTDFYIVNLLTPS